MTDILQMAKSEPVLTVAICTRNRRPLLLRSLASLGVQELDAPWEVLVVDNGSSDDTAEAVAALEGDFPVELRLASEPEQGLSHARNRALREARGRFVVYVDDDGTCRPGWVAAHAQALAAPDVLATGGRILPVLPEDLDPAWRAHLEREPGGPTGRYDFGTEPQEIPGPLGIRLPFGGNFGIDRARAQEVGGFRSDLGWGRELVPGEETDLLQRLARLPGRMLYVPGAVLDHHLDGERAGVDYYLRWQRGFGRSRVRRNPPASGAERLRRAAREVARAVWWSVRARGLRARCERERALGCALELLFGPRFRTGP